VTRSEWLRMPWLIRMWRVLFCAHPDEQQRLLVTVRNPDRDDAEAVALLDPLIHVVNVFECQRCLAHHLDEGHRFTRPLFPGHVRTPTVMPIDPPVYPYRKPAA
jgi:hypothetical protein